MNMFHRWLLSGLMILPVISSADVANPPLVDQIFFIGPTNVAVTDPLLFEVAIQSMDELHQVNVYLLDSATEATEYTVTPIVVPPSPPVGLMIFSPGWSATIYPSGSPGAWSYTVEIELYLDLMAEGPVAAGSYKVAVDALDYPGGLSGATVEETVVVVGPGAPDPDTDADGWPDSVDNCPGQYNPGQENNDGDPEGDACDNDDDNDTVLDVVDNCPFLANPDQADVNMDGFGDACVPVSTEIDPSADVDPSVDVGEDVAVDKGVAVGSGSSIGDGASLDKNAEVGSHSDIGAGVEISQGVIVGNHVTIGEGAILDRGVVLCDRSVVGPYAQIGRDSEVGYDGEVFAFEILPKESYIEGPSCTSP